MFCTSLNCTLFWYVRIKSAPIFTPIFVRKTKGKGSEDFGHQRKKLCLFALYPNSALFRCTRRSTTRI